MTYEPFTPAGSDGPHHRGGDQRGYDGRRRRVEEVEPTPQGQWAQPGQWAEPAADPWAAPQRDQWAEPAPSQWTQAPRRQQWAEDPQWPTSPAPVPQQRHAFTGEQAAPAPRTGNRVKPVVVGAVVLLLLVAGWQAYRIESMSKHNQDLATVLSAEQDRTDRLEQQLAGVFDPEGVSSKVLPSVFRVRAGNFTGTAFSVGKKATGNQANLITNYHVVAETWTDGGRRVTLERGSTRINATIVKVDKTRDLALLSAGQKIPALGTATGQVKPGQQVVVVGAPLGLDDSVTTGVISAYRPDDPDGPTVQFDAPINPGNSGGPVVNANEQVVGVATAKAKDAEGIGLAIPIKTACDTLKVC
ncbi:trypsin-like peptidase domain-containing protein [Actinoplanes bogorensis]|uniref:Trypsin-like peptidase domain-containing protein n=2 Tax=Paractinoplanes bogorensis TaxID=1610840 RepID=A0ABS5YG93_9ACTN|nr:trypsin-like peptidase domain-containing protein [Actinoplanes bogorensis]